MYYILLGGCAGIRVFNATFNNISAISWQSVLLVEFLEKTTNLLHGAWA
jgi:hypothetical protein